MNRIEALHHLNESEDLVLKSLEEVNLIALGKDICFPKERKYYIIDKVEELEPNRFTFWLKQTKGRKDDSRRAIGTNAIALGKVTTTDESLIKLCNELYKNTEAENQNKETQRIQLIKDRENKKELELKKKIEDTIKRAKYDFSIGNKENYKLLTGKKQFSKEAEDFGYFYDVSTYINSFEEEEEKARRQSLVQNRITFGLSDYPGDLKKLLEWIKLNVTDVSIKANSQAAEREQEALNLINEERGTNYQVEVTEDIYPVYSIRFKNSNTAPEEFKKWVVKKHSNETSNPTIWKDAPAMNRGTLKSNNIVKDLLFNPEYNFVFIKK